MIRVERVSSEAPAGSVEAFIAGLDERPGAWLGCDVEAEGLYEVGSSGCENPSLGFFLDGRVLTIQALTAVGQALFGYLRPLAGFTEAPGELSIRFADEGRVPHPVLSLLRAFLAQFKPGYPELALYGAFSFDYYRLAGTVAVPDDGRRRMALFFPGRVLVTKRGVSRWVSFEFPGLDIPSAVAAMPAPRKSARAAESGDLPLGKHASRVREGIERLRRGEVYSLVLSQTFHRPVNAKPSDALGALRKLNPYPAMFFLNFGGGEKLFGASPDIQVRADSQWVESAPVCGTFRRGTDPLDDADQALALLNSEKEEASLAACADADRNDKGRVCQPGTLESVTRRRLHFFSTIIHTIDHARGRRRESADVFDILLAHSTPATVTGIPKAAAIRAIGEIESSWRGWYAGAVARLATDGSMEALTILRAASITDGVAEVRTGGNLLVDSDPDKEEEETRLKAETLFRVLRGESPKAKFRRAESHRSFEVSFQHDADPLADLLAEALARSGCTLVEDASRAIVVLGDASVATVAKWTAMGRPLIAVGSGALALLQSQGGRLTGLSHPRYARRSLVTPSESGILGDLGPVEQGFYAKEFVAISDLPGSWRADATTPEGWVAVASSVGRPMVAITCRPDSVQSMKNNAGIRLLSAALAWAAGWKPASEVR